MSASNTQPRVFDNTEEFSNDIIGFDSMTDFEKACAIISNDPLTPYGHRDIVEALFPSFKGMDAYSGITRPIDTFPTLTSIVTSPELVDPKTTSLLMGPRVKLEHLQQLYKHHYPKNLVCGKCAKHCSFCDTCACFCKGISICIYTGHCQSHLYWTLPV